MLKLHLKTTDLSNAQQAFNTYSKERITLRFNKPELASLVNMIDECGQLVSDEDSELERIILKEIRQQLVKKYNTITFKSNFPLSCSQARTLFFWLNGNTFAHPLEDSFSRKVVDEIYKQVI